MVDGFVGVTRVCGMTGTWECGREMRIEGSRGQRGMGSPALEGGLVILGAGGRGRLRVDGRASVENIHNIQVSRYVHTYLGTR